MLSVPDYQLIKGAPKKLSTSYLNFPISPLDPDLFLTTQI